MRVHWKFLHPFRSKIYNTSTLKITLPVSSVKERFCLLMERAKLCPATKVIKLLNAIVGFSWQSDTRGAEEKDINITEAQIPPDGHGPHFQNFRVFFDYMLHWLKQNAFSDNNTFFWHILWTLLDVIWKPDYSTKRANFKAMMQSDLPERKKSVKFALLWSGSVSNGLYSWIPHHSSCVSQVENSSP